MQELLDVQVFTHSHPCDLEKRIDQWLKTTCPEITSIYNLGPGSLAIFFRRSDRKVRVKLIQFYFHNDLGPMLRRVMQDEQIESVSMLHLLSPGELLVFFVASETPR